MVFSENRISNIYPAATAPKTVVTNAAKAVKDENVGSIAIGTFGDQDDKSFYIMQKGFAGLNRSDIIKVKNIRNISYTPAAKMQRELKSQVIKLSPRVNNGNPVAGETYIVNITFEQFLSLSEYERYVKFGAVKAYTGMTPTQFYKQMALSIANGFMRDINQDLVEIYLMNNEAGSSLTKVEIGSKVSDYASVATAYGVVVMEKEQDWVLGRIEQLSVPFTVQPNTINIPGADGVSVEEALWATYIDDANPIETADLPKISAPVVGNGKKTADLEWFLMGTRGDTYRNNKWPKVIDTKYMVDPSEEYDYVTINYYFEGTGENVQKSEKTIYIPCITDDADSGLIGTVATAYKTAFDTILDI